MSQLQELSKPFSQGLVKSKIVQGNRLEYVAHSEFNQRLLHVVGAFDITNVEPIRGYVPDMNTKAGKTYLGGDNLIVGALITLRLEIDGRDTTIVEVGDVENPQLKNHDGERLKDAVSDAFKRACMRLGLGLHLRAERAYFLDKVLERDELAAIESAKSASDELADSLAAS